ncbi:acetyl/propionyl/methylcrotonyl-CoA carboxylase subunit alpha [Actinokineospora globicatena]|uniref:Biotin-dependent 3-methylcrotonyl-coenzyme A carboxylase alpha1 subunit n=1 Tax=Actinokineospora globicatena TaxID=103729 RepID=A0A9W6VD77_9PSEU|nr:acetyl/propionyl/methylcrotonyl-CoA carboxylase subunit alpha [Actinokineospora globicatena]GLW95734.1 acetyl/propionyl-CoA carboxylase subuit alpha [Actinokineospora globicatena]
MFSSVLIANRGEIAVRVITTLRRMGIRSVAVYSDADAGARHVREADVAVRIGPAAARESYLAIDKVVAAALETGAEAVHPGYGFLAENVEFARACAAAGLVFIGPPASAIDAMGDKIRAKLTVSAAGVPVVPGRTQPGMSDDDLVDAAEEIGYPVLLKPSAGGGGKGMRLVEASDGLRAAIESARREARGSFGDETLLIERFVLRPRHIEIQVLADSHGHAIHLGERECSLQRRHQKIIEEAPSPLLDEATRARMGAAAVDAAKAVDYSGAGTVEFIVSADRPDEFFFMEMNTRLQVEHPVTEQVTGLDLVEQQIRVAAGEPLALVQDDVVLRGHAIEARVYAEDPSTGFLPTGGRVLDVRSSAADWARLDSGLLPGSVVGSDYDPMLAKVITWGADRGQAIDRLSAALGSTAVLGVGTNIAFLRALLADADVRAGRLDTQLVERRLDELTRAEPVPDEVFAAAALDELLALQPAGGVVDPWSVPSGWRVGRPAPIPFRLTCGDRDVTVSVTGSPAAARVQVGDGSAVDASVSRVDGELRVTLGGRNLRYARALDGDTLWLAAEGRTWAVAEHSALEGAAATAAGGGPITSPMPGTVLVVKVSAGERVDAGAPLLVVEAMKMEHTITAKVGGVVSELLVQAGNQVALNQTLAVVTPSED